jgi:hypothetical protein
MKVVLAAAAILLIVLVVGLHYIPQNDEPLTELYFDNHTMLPTAATPVVTPLPLQFSFAIHNLEGQSLEYRYTVVLQTGSENVTLQTGNVTLADNETMHIPVNAIIYYSFNRASVNVGLVGRNESIHFWLGELNS